MTDPRLRRLSHWRLKLLSIVVASLSPITLAYGIGQRDALWQVVEGLCVPMNATFGISLPCLKVDSTRRFVVIRAPGDETHIIVVPTQRIAGIESPALFSPDTPNLWAIAWNERSWVSGAAGRSLEWSDIGMAINSSVSRTQDQLHIHVDCVDPRLKHMLANHAKNISGRWSEFDLPPWAGRYRVKRIGHAELDRGIFQMVADEIAGAREHMGLQTIGVIGAQGPKGEKDFVVFVNSHGGHAEELLDRQCPA